MTKSRPPITAMQYKFAENYIKNGYDAKNAALQAGYSMSYALCKTGALLDQPAVKERIEQAFQAADKRLQVAWEWKIKKLVKVVDHFIPDEADQLNAHNVRVAISAIAELNKMHGDYAPEKRLSMTIDATKERLEAAKRQYEEY